MDFIHRLNVQELEYRVSNVELQRLLEKQFDLTNKPWNKNWGFSSGGAGRHLPLEVLFAERKDAMTFAATLNELFGIVVDHPFEVVSPAPEDAVWTQERATSFIEEIRRRFMAAGFQRPQVIGGVGQFGYSMNDLDLLLKPARPMTLDKAIGFVEEEILPLISDEKVVNPLECGDRNEVWFLNIELRPDVQGNKRVVEFYMAESDFPMETDEPQRPGVKF